jgi:HEAT repeat protein
MAPPSDRVEDLIRQLEHSKWQAREAACQALGKLGEARAVEPLIARLYDQDTNVCWAAAEALGEMGHPAVDLLIERLSRARVTERPAACGALGRLGDARAVAPLVARLSDADRELREAAAEALKPLGQGRFANALLGAWDGREDAFDSLAALAGEGDLRAVDPMVARLEDRVAAVRMVAGQALKRMSKALKPLLGELLCGFCLARFGEKKSTRKASWFACRVCGKAGKALAGIKQVVAVLDEGWNQDLDGRQGVLWVNWMKRRIPFDFDRVEVIRVSDYEVERLCIAVGNDTDDRRSAGYKTMECVVALDSGVSESTLGMLRTTFGKVSA